MENHVNQSKLLQDYSYLEITYKINGKELKYILENQIENEVDSKQTKLGDEIYITQCFCKPYYFKQGLQKH